MHDKRDRKRIANILREPLTRHRLSLANALRAAQHPETPVPFDFDKLKAFVEGIGTSDAGYKKEVVNILEAVQTGVAPQRPAFDTPAKQLAWGAALSYLSGNAEQMKTWATPPAEGASLTETALWKQVTGTVRAREELLSHGWHVSEASRDKNTKYSWGAPGTGFAYDRGKNRINIDFAQSLIVGFEHARADVYREIGHAILSVSYPRRMQEIYTEMQPLLRIMRQSQDKKKKGPQLKPDEYKRLVMLSTEWELRHKMFAAGEENVASRFVANMGRQMLQDYGVSLNNTAVTHRGIGLTRLPDDGSMADDLKRYLNLCNAVQLSFFQNNGLFDDTDKGWFGVGVNPNLVRKTATLAARAENAKDDTDGVDHADFKELRALCGGPKGLENLQPKQHERLYGWANLHSRIVRADQERNAVIEKIWALYGEDLLQNVLKQANDQLDEQLKEAQEQQQQQGQDGDDQDQDGDDQDGQDQDGQQQDGQGQSGKGKPQKSKKDKDKQKQKQNKDRGRQQGEQQDPDDADDGDDADGQQSKKDKKKQDKKDQSGKKEKGDKDKGDKGDQDDADNGASEDGDDQDGQQQKGDGDEKDGQDQDGDAQKGDAESKVGQDEEETVPVEGAGDMPAPKQPTELPQDEVDPDGADARAEGDGDDADADGQDGDGQDADGEDGDDADAQTVDEMEDALEDARQEEADADGEGQDQDGDDADADGQDGEGQGQKSKKNGKKSRSKSSSKQGGKEKGTPLGDLSKQDWTNYSARIAELSGPISRVRKIFKDIQERQLQRKPKMSRTLDILPENGEVKDRFNVEAHRNMTIKKATGQLEENDLKRFHRDENQMTPTSIDIVIAIDGSASMRGVAINSAMQASAIMFEAAAGKDMNMNVYVVMWGDDDPPVIIRPDADRVSIGRAMEGARQTLNSGTRFAPAMAKIAKMIGEQRGKSGVMSGFTHILVLSDGDMMDAPPSISNIEAMFSCSDKVTIDAAVINTNPNTAMKQMADKVGGNKPHHQMGVYLGSNPDEIPLKIVGLLREKIHKCGSFVAQPASKKRREMQRAERKMKPK